MKISLIAIRKNNIFSKKINLICFNEYYINIPPPCIIIFFPEHTELNLIP